MAYSQLKRDYKLAVGTAYRPPWKDVDSFVDAQCNSLNSLSSCIWIVLLGDFNINYLNELDPKTVELN